MGKAGAGRTRRTPSGSRVSTLVSPLSAIRRLKADAGSRPARLKIAAISCYKSQFHGERIKRLTHYVRSMAGAEGAWAGFAYGETYALPRPVAVTDMVALMTSGTTPSAAAKDAPDATEGQRAEDALR